MENEKFVQMINKIIDTKLESMSNLANPNHAHNGYDVNQLDPAVALTGFPVIQVADATVSPLVSNPNDKPQSGTFRFYVDTTPRFRFWAYLTYQNTSAQLIGSWRVISLT